MIPVTRKELYLNKIVGNDDYDIPEKPISEEELFFAEILGEAVQAPEPLTRYQMYLAKIAGRNISVPKPLTRIELFLAKACGMDIETPTPITREEIFWSNYSAIVEFEVEGVPPLTYKAIEGTLENYRIYGNTVDGESVGDRTGNLFDKNSQSVPGFINSDGDISVASYPTTTYDFISVDASADYTYRAFNAQDTSSSNVNLRVAFYNSDKAFISRYFKNDVTLSGNTIKTPDDCRYIRLSVDDNLTDLMFIEGATIPTNYEPYGYKVPVAVSNGTDTLTTPIYLPEQIRKVGDEAEYIDYGEQKMHRVRKNLLQNTATNLTTYGVTITVNDDGSVTCNGTATSTIVFLFFEKELGQNTYILSGCPENGAQNERYKVQINPGDGWYADIGNGLEFEIQNTSTIKVRLVIYPSYTCNNLTFYPMIRKADIDDDTYEPYIEDTELDVTLPALPTLSGTNTLTVGTEVQPSNVYIKYEGVR